MSTIRFARRVRRDAPRAPGGEVSLQAPPDIPRATPGNLLMKLLPLVMVAAMIGMVALMFGSGMARSPMALVFPLMMMVSMIGMLANSGRGGGAKTAEANEDRKDYLRYLDTLRGDVAETGSAQRRALEWTHPDPALLWTLVGTVRMWERRTSDADFCHVRVGLGGQRLATKLIAPETGPVEDLEPVAAVSLRRFVRAHSVVPALPTAVSMRGFASVGISGDREAAQQLARAMLAQLCTFHAPDVLQVAVVCGPDTAAEWEWVKWLPHAQHPEARDGAGSTRMVFGSVLELETVLGVHLSSRGRFVRNAPAVETVPQLLIVIDGGVSGSGSGLLDEGLDSVTLLDLSGFAPRLAAHRGLQLVVENGRLGARTGSSVETFAEADGIGAPQSQALARRLAPYRAATQFATDDGADTGSIENWQDLLGLGDIARLDPLQAWAPRSGRDRLRVPIGIGVDGAPVEIDLKESAENGMGPHGLCIGATGSGKSEFLRTLVLGLVATHSPDALNLVLIDFKGGATFLGLDRSPHVAAVITNLADELAMVERMKDALEGEMTRRQELLRAAGNFANVGDYERARSAGAPLAPLPALFIVVDEFSELLAQQPEFADLFAAIGRLGRSLHMHLLLASQRLDEGKLRGLDSHLSYRIGLKTFSANESRSVLGVPDAYSLPPTPGAGYLKCDSAEIVRFDAAYVSGPYEPGRPARRSRTASAGTVGPRVFTARDVPADRGAPLPVPPVSDPNPDTEATTTDGGRTVLDVVVGRVRGHGTPAHEVWLPPLDESPSLDRILSHSLLTGDVLRQSTLRTTIGIVDRPFEQRRDPLVVDLSGAAGNAIVVGGPQSGKSTLLRTLIVSLAATHTAEQVQFYCLDFGGGTLAGLSGLPHVGSVANRLAADRVRRTVAELMGLLRRREQQFGDWGLESMSQMRRLRADGAPHVSADPFGDVFLVIDGWPSIREDFEPLEQSVGVLASRGLSYGIHVVISAPRWWDVRPALRDHLGTRLELRLGDPADSEYGRKKAALVPEGRPGRGIERDGLHVLAALPRVDGSAGVDDLSEGVAAAVAAIAAATPGGHAPAVRMLPEEVDRAAVLAALPGGWPISSNAPVAQRLRVPIGIDEAELAPVALDFAESPHLLVFGDSECGKTTLLHGICRSLMESNTGAQARIIIGDYRRTMLGVVEGDHLGGYAPSGSVLSTMAVELAGIFERRLPGADTTQQQLRDRSWWTGPEVFVIVDDYDLVASSGQNPLTPLLEYLPQAKDIGLHLIIARRAGGASRALYEPVIARLRELSTPGLIMCGSRDEGALIGTARPGPMPPGRGILVRRNGNELIQTARLQPS
ncbi:type VII secretion protein EccCa [Rhodococcus sp. F64268]|uniref:type VII secretion protein EccCa n=1 Tax=Rhodococcus sp. F64268 TaxID=2926402 RepID=UPI001FF1E905|nr:type VII secretion protein EccCa [Rhodococcus sp. F64268]MCK0093293.1 type VII secretion protein EccCa [Rhodococcus sp. F64268]